MSTKSGLRHRRYTSRIRYLPTIRVVLSGHHPDARLALDARRKKKFYGFLMIISKFLIFSVRTSRKLLGIIVRTGDTFPVETLP